MTETRYHDRKKKYYEAHKEEIDARAAQWMKDNPEAAKEIRKRKRENFMAKMDAEYPGGYKAYIAEAKRKHYAKKKAKAEAEKKAASSTGLESSPQAQPTQ